MEKRTLNYTATLFTLLIITLSNIVHAQVVVKDIFDRELNNYQVTLVDWQGHLMNPMVELKLSPPPSGVTFPLNVTVKAQGSSRLMLDLPSTLSSNGASKTVTFQSATATHSIFLEIAPDRQGGYGEIESYTLTFEYENTSNSLPIKVIDLDDDLEAVLPLHFDYRYDVVNGIFDNPDIKAAAELAINDWFYFFDFSSFDEVPAGDEDIWLPGNDWQNHIQATNNEAYDGYWAFMRGIDSPYSTGFPSDNAKYIKQDGVQLPGPMHRSSALVLHFYPDANVFTSTNDDDWYLTDLYTYTDVYGVVMHEFGHAIAYHDHWQGFGAYKNNYANVQEVANYQGIPIPIDGYGHIPADEKYWDRLSGQSAGWNAKFPARRWMLTKLTLLIAEQVGWTLRDIGPFASPEILTDNLPNTESGVFYSQTLESNGGGVPFYDWTIKAGALPDGVTLNRFTGLVSGDVGAKEGVYNFTVQLKDYDELQAPVTKELSIEVSSNVSSATSIRLPDEHVLYVYPNPARDILHVQTNKDTDEYVIYTLRGMKMLESNKRIVDVSGLPQGVYILQTSYKSIQFVKLK